MTVRRKPEPFWLRPVAWLVYRALRWTLRPCWPSFDEFYQAAMADSRRYRPSDRRMP